MPSIPAQLRAAREQVGLTQQELADRLGVQQSNVAAVETGKRVIGLPLLRRWASACGVEVKLE